MLEGKLALVAASVLLATLVARRFGHGIGGTIGGLPMIAGPIVGFVLWQEPLPQVRAIVLATLTCLPAAVLHMSTLAHLAARGWRWWTAVIAVNALFVAGCALLLALRPTPWAAALMTLAAPPLGLALMPRLRLSPGRVDIPQVELLLRIGAAVAMAWAIVEAAGSLPPLVSGVLLATPIAANVLPCFTLPRYGAAATVALMAGFVRGLSGFAAFFVTLHLALGRLPMAGAYALAWFVAVAVALAVYAAQSAWRRALSPQ
jgi:hypothetical protein